MKFTLEKSAGHRVQSVSADGVSISGDLYTKSFVLSAQQLQSDWACQDINDLSIAHMQALANLQPNIVVIGTGNRLQFPAPEIRAFFPSQNIGVEFMDTTAACRTYNVLADEGRNVIAAVIVDQR